MNNKGLVFCGWNLKKCNKILIISLLLISCSSNCNKKINSDLFPSLLMTRQMNCGIVAHPAEFTCWRTGCSDENCFTDHLLNDFCDHTCAVPFPFTVADNVKITSANGSGSSVNRKFVVKKENWPKWALRWPEERRKCTKTAQLLYVHVDETSW